MMPQDPAHAQQPGRFRTLLMKFFGPPDLGSEHHGNPLTGTRYDPELKRARRQARKGSTRKR